MPTYTVDSSVFQADGAVVNWDSDAKRLGMPIDGNHPYGSVIELRWMLKAENGLPTEPFLVWARQHSASAGFKPLVFVQRQLIFAGNMTLISWPEGSMSSLTLTVTAPLAGSVLAFAGGPLFSNIVASASIPSGATTVSVSAKLINCLVVTPGITVTAVQGLPQGGYANTPGWTLVEIVGLPVKLTDWSGIGKHGEPQGLKSVPLTDAPTAAIARLKRGAPPFGWSPTIAMGVPAPAWSAPGFGPLIGEVNGDLLSYLHDIVKNYPPNQQSSIGVTVPLPPPKNSLGQHTNKPGSNTQLFPLGMAYMAASTDAFLSLALGFGTAYPYRESGFAALPGADFMITAHWEKGFDGVSGPQDYAAIVTASAAALPPPAPANMGGQPLGALRPFNTDGDWRESVRVFWDRPPAAELYRAASCAVARASISPAQPAVALMDTRPSGGYRYIAINGQLSPPHAQDPEWWRIHVMDRELDIPFNPGTRQMKYGAAVQNLYGQWTSWTAIDQTVVQPDLDAVRMMNVALRPIAPVNGSVCATTLEVDFLWDWRIRTPRQITFVGRLYAAAHHGDPPPSVVVPAGLDRSLAGGGAALVVTFAGDTPSAPGATFLPFSEDGSSQVPAFGPGQGNSRRYRMTLSGLSLDFGSTGFIGLALWAQGQELIAPNRVSAWQDNPVVISAGDPRPPIVPIFHVKLGSVPDAAGSSHVQISWTPQPNATGYFVYEATEASLRDTWGLPEPNQKDTLDVRLKVLRDNFQANPVRRPFTRWNSTQITSTGTDIALPRGSTGIHLFVVLGVSAGQVESAWPSGPNPQDALIAIAAPHITKPAPPMIEVQRILDSSVMPPAYKAKVLVTTRTGPRPAMVELYRVRVDDAAVEVDTMGPPVAQLKSTAGGWVVTQTPDPDYGPYITTVQGTDAPSGSWKRVWYRATAWTGQDDTRGSLPGRSEASNAAWVVLPPSDGPVISPLSVGGGPTLGDVLIEWISQSPLKRTPLGPHQMSVRATLPGVPPPPPPPAPSPLISLDSTLDALGHTQPATGSGVWIVGTAAGVTTYRAIIRRAAVTDTVNFAVRITDPIGRTGSQLLTIASGPVDPPPDLENLQLKKLMLPPPPHLSLTFTSTSPVIAPLSGPYVLKVTGVPFFPVIFPPPLSLTMPLGSVPTKLPPGPPPPTYILRTGTGPQYTYHLVTTAHLKGFVVRITAPNGKFVESQV